jgi:uncharacterized delta-60 repeat protein
MKKAFTTFITILLLGAESIAQLGGIDANFNLGTGFGPDQWTGKCHSIVQQADGKLIVGGQFKTFNGDTTYYITRLNIDGTKDPNFTSQFTNQWGYDIRTIALQNDGKIVIGGEFSTIHGKTQGRIARLNSNGTFDTTFKPAAGFNLQVNTVCMQTDGKILVGGIFNVYDYPWGGSQTPVNGIARLNPDGTLDTTFKIGTGFSGGSGIGQRQVHKILVQPDGKILVSGHYGIYNGDTSILVTRLNSNGSMDKSFNANANFSISLGGFYGQVYDMKILPDNKIMISGNYGNSNGLAKGLDRLNADGSLDTSFKIKHSTDYRCFAFDVQSDGKILSSAVNFGPPNEAYLVERLKTDGSIDSIFPKKFVNSDITDLIVQQDGNITFVGYFSYNPTGIMRLIGDTSMEPPMGIAYAHTPHLHFELYPNPANDIIFLKNLEKGSVIKLMDNSGKKIWIKQIEGNQTHENISELVSGIYFVQLEHNGLIATKKLVVNK